MTHDTNHTTPGTADPAGVVRAYLEAYFSGDLDTARALVRDDFSFRAPLVDGGGTKDMFFAGSEAKVRHVDEVRILRQWQDGGDVSTVYELRIATPQGSAPLLLHEWHTVVDGRLAASTLIFDTAGPGPTLLRDALAHAHG